MKDRERETIKKNSRSIGWSKRTASRKNGGKKETVEGKGKIVEKKISKMITDCIKMDENMKVRKTK